MKRLVKSADENKHYSVPRCHRHARRRQRVLLRPWSQCWTPLVKSGTKLRCPFTAWPLLGWRAGIFIRILVLRVVGGDAADEREESSAAAFGVSRGGGI